ncbi:MAG: bifunctional folylpolyglutamate synthase/dihydrofolate synthase [Blautia sp.]|nr:bifunctional folylpolyglutamate synthase/dihydrofolate synthase [Blautia sp.]
MDYREARDLINTAGQYGSVLGLENMKALMHSLGNPQDDLQVIHIAGTNGKGSTAAYLYSVLCEAGYHVGRYVSPTLYSYLERIQIGSRNISESEFAAAMTKVSEAAHKMTEKGLPHPTAFELETAAAYVFFKDSDCDIALVEVGMGGDLDATNIISTPRLCVLTSISMDHTAVLGNTLGEIAEKKAGIIKENSLVVSTIQKPEVETVIRTVCRERGAAMIISDFRQAQVLEESYQGQKFVYQGEVYEISLGGICQIENAVLALNVLEALSKTVLPDTEMHQETLLRKVQIQEAPLRKEQLRKASSTNREQKKEIPSQKIFPTSIEQRRIGLRSTLWNGRFTTICDHPLFIVDGAHNPAAADRLAEAVERYFSGRDIYYIIGVFADKDYEYILRRMSPYAKEILTIETPDNPRALPAERLAEAVLRYHPKVRAMGSIPQAVTEVFRIAGERDVILSFGSLSFIGLITEEVHRIYDRSGNQQREDR